LQWKRHVYNGNYFTASTTATSTGNDTRAMLASRNAQEKIR